MKETLEQDADIDVLESSKEKEDNWDVRIRDVMHNLPCKLPVVEEECWEVTYEDFVELEGSLAGDWREEWILMMMMPFG